MNPVQLFLLFNTSIRVLPKPVRLRCWVGLGDAIAIAPRQLLAVECESVDGGPRTLVLRLTTPVGEVEIRNPESLSFHTTQALVRAVKQDAHGVVRVLLDIGDLVTAPAWRMERIA